MNGRFRRVAASTVVLALLLLPACSPSASSSPSAAGGGSTIDVTLQEWAVVVSEASAPAGEIARLKARGARIHVTPRHSLGRVDLIAA